MSRQPQEGTSEGAVQQKRQHKPRSMLKAVTQHLPNPSQPAPPNYFFSKSNSELPHAHRAVEQLELEPQRDGFTQQILPMPQPLSQSQLMVVRSEQAFGERANHKGTDSDNSHETLNCECRAASEARSGGGANAAQPVAKRPVNVEPEQDIDISPLANNEQSIAKRAKLSDPPYMQALDWERLMAAFTPAAAPTASSLPPSSWNADASAAATDSEITGQNVLATVCENGSDSAFGAGNSVGQHNSGCVYEGCGSLLTPSSISSVGENLTNASLRRRTFESTSDSANNPIAMISRLAADTTVTFAPQDGIFFPKPYSRPECEAAFQAQHVCRRPVPCCD